MASLVIIAIVLAVSGTMTGAYIRICFAIRQEDRKKWSLRLDAASQAGRIARALVGLSNSRWD